MRLFLDIGAFNGALSLRAANSGLYDAVHAFEPNPACKRAFHQLIYWHPFVAWECNGVMPFCFGFQGQEPTQGSSCYSDKPMGEIVHGTVDCINLGAFLRSCPEGDIDLHMDAEGAEYTILPHLIDSALAYRITRLSVEWHAEKIPSISAATDKAVRAMVAALDKPECLVREEA